MRVTRELRRESDTRARSGRSRSDPRGDTRTTATLRGHGRRTHTRAQRELLPPLLLLLLSVFLSARGTHAERAAAADALRALRGFDRERVTLRLLL